MIVKDYRKQDVHGHCTKQTTEPGRSQSLHEKVLAIVRNSTLSDESKATELCRLIDEERATAAKARAVDLRDESL